MNRIPTLLGAVLLVCSAAHAKDVPSNPNIKFDHAEYLQATTAGQKKAAPAVKGTLYFDTEKKSVDFLDEKGGAAFSIKYEMIKSILYEKTSNHAMRRPSSFLRFSSFRIPRSTS